MSTYAESLQKTRSATDEEKQAMRERMAETLAALRSKANPRAASRADEIERAIDGLRVPYWETVTRPMTKEEKALKAADKARAQREEIEEKRARAERVALLRRAAANMKLSHAEFLIAFPTDVSVEELDAK